MSKLHVAFHAMTLSMFFLPGSQLTGLTQGVIYTFSHVDGVFGLLAPPEEIYVRSMDDAAVAAP